jgi:Cu2+-exporting ATPase
VIVEALRPVGHSYLMRVAALVRMAQAGKPALQRLADRIAGWFVPAVILLAAFVFVGHYLLMGQGSGAALMVALSVVLIACPCAMGLAVPAAVLAACSRAAALGVILRGGDVIERLAAIDTVFFDKTGTLTAGQPVVTDVALCGAASLTDLLEAAATVEQQAAHPLARAIVGHAAQNGVLPDVCHNFSMTPGRGIAGTTGNGRHVLCGSRRFLQEQGIPEDLLPLSVPGSETEVVVAVDGAPWGRILLSDRIRPGTQAVVTDLGRKGIDIHLVSGDTPEVVSRIAAESGIGRASGGLSPDQKLDLVSKLQGEGRIVLMAGDGVNDAPALAAANVSCSLVGASDIALENADIIIAADDLARLATAHRIACRTMTVIKQNLGWAFLYNLIGIPLAVCGVLTPVYAAVAMISSSLLVSLNSLRLMRIKHHG